MLVLLALDPLWKVVCFSVESGVQQAVKLSFRVEVLSSPLRFVQQLSNANSIV